jgi:hypothetical protein
MLPVYRFCTSGPGQGHPGTTAKPDAFSCILHCDEKNGIDHEESIMALKLRLTKLPRDLKDCDYEKYNRLMDVDQIDTTVIQEWIETCDRLHEPEAQDIAPLLSASQLPWIYLIDLERQCLVKIDTPKKPRYIALSYVWGGVDMLKTTTKNLEDMLQPGALLHSQEITGPRLAQTIVDAMDLARKLGCPFFWTNCICIVQDEEDERTMFLNGMASIYANAYLTVVAGEGDDGNHGIPHIGRCSRPRNTLCSELRFPGHTLSLGPNVELTPAIYCNGTAWSTRGWTFQESYLSRRLLVFTSIISFHCREHSSVEWELKPHGANNLWVDRTSFICDVPDWPDICYFTEVAGAYSQRHLSFDDDVLYAFAGVTTMLNQPFHSGFHHGLPKVFFDASLLWESDWKRPDPPRIRKTQKLSLPSWSWVRMKGSIQTRVWQRFAEDFYKDAWFRDIYELKPRVQWWKTNSKGEALKLIDHQHFKGHASMPPGWNLPTFRRNVHRRRDVKYSHALSPGKLYPNPFPFHDSVEASSPDNIYGPILRCIAKRGWLFKSSKLEQHGCNRGVYGIFNLCVGDGTWAGILIDDRLDQSFPQRSDEKCEVIAIAEGRVPGMYYDYVLPEHAMLLQALFPERPVFEMKIHESDNNLLNRKSFCYEFYFILWIGWIDGIAYRRGIGRVLKSVWESMDLEDIEVRLD